MSTIFETDACIGPGGLLELGVMPFPEGWMVHVKVEPKEADKDERRGFALGLHKGMIEMAEDFDEPLPDSFWLGEGET